MKQLLIATLLIAATLTTGCATKSYGRQGQVSPAEKQILTCREITLEVAKVDGYLKQVDHESSFDLLSVASFLGDFGIGNALEHDAALKSAAKRSGQLNMIWVEKGCITGSLK